MKGWPHGPWRGQILWHLAAQADSAPSELTSFFGSKRNSPKKSRLWSCYRNSLEKYVRTCVIHLANNFLKKMFSTQPRHCFPGVSQLQSRGILSHLQWELHKAEQTNNFFKVQNWAFRIKIKKWNLNLLHLCNLAPLLWNESVSSSSLWVHICRAFCSKSSYRRALAKLQVILYVSITSSNKTTLRWWLEEDVILDIYSIVIQNIWNENNNTISSFNSAAVPAETWEYFAPSLFAGLDKKPCGIRHSIGKKWLRFRWVHFVGFFDRLLRSAKLHLWDWDAECQAALATPLACSTCSKATFSARLRLISVCSSFPLCRACRASWSSLGASETTRAVANVAGHYPVLWEQSSIRPIKSPSKWCTVCSSCVAERIAGFFK